MPSRRRLLAGAAGLAALAASGLPRPALAQAKPKVVVVGGGAGGASVVRALAARAGEALDVTLVEPERTYTTCFYSNLHLGGLLPFDAMRFGFERIAALPGVTVVAERASAIERERREVVLAGGARLPYDRLVLAPGIDLDYGSVPGWSQDAEERMPHAWKAGPQTALLKRQIDAVPDGGLVVVIAPPDPYRCPPGPYERVSMIAHALTATGRTQARIVILDPKEKFSKQPLFQQAWEQHYPGMIEWLPPMIHGGVRQVDPATLSVETDFETYREAALVNVIPRQTAGRIALAAGLAADNGFCPIDPFSMRSQRDPGIFVLGDAAIAGDMPKSAFAANSQAQTVAQALATDLLDARAVEAAYHNRCWSLIDADDSVYVGGDYQPTPEKIAQTATYISALDDTAETRRQNYDDSAAWYAGLTAALYG